MASRPNTSRTPPGRPSKQTRLGVVIVDPLPVVRAGLALLIDDLPDMEVLAEAGSADEVVEALARLRRSKILVLVGLGLDGGHDSFWLIRTIREQHPSLTVLGCGGRADPMAISRALFVGADGYVDKNVHPAEFVEALRAVAGGEMVLVGPPAEWVGAIADGIDRRHQAEQRLTTREREVLTVAAEGLTSRQIGERLGMREKTVSTHLSRIYGKLGVGTRVAAIRVAALSGLVSVGRLE
jgi:DNA-binding NarL/FixJ family response regulator